MSKKANPRRFADNEASASLKSLRISPQKLNIIASMIRGKSIEKALKDLMMCRKRAAKDVQKLLLSAIANAETNHGLDVDELFIREAYVGKSITMKRFMARARGRGSRIIKPFSRINIIVGISEGAV
ncbi:MAG: 50S ribosomal protein L22 [Caedimonas sp.]|jgi:large subunit ribosomal protein L22|nr:50S ribosomal protein L22 [Caedimonas sp.]